jgi:hypothetical protein
MCFPQNDMPCLTHSKQLKKKYFIVLMTDVVRISETSVYFNETTRRYPEGCHLQVEKLFNLDIFCEISSSHGGEYDVQNCLLGFTAV